VRRRYTVRLSSAEARRLRTYDDAEARHSVGLPPPMILRREAPDRFVTDLWTRADSQGALTTSRGTVTLTGEGTAEVVLRSRNRWYGWFLVAMGVFIAVLALRDGIWMLLLGLALVAVGWFAYASPWMQDHDLDDVERFLREHVGGEWQPA
jgi:hypothetical protein